MHVTQGQELIAVEINTTGPNPYADDIVALAFVPIRIDGEVDRSRKRLLLDLKPQNVDAKLYCGYCLPPKYMLEHFEHGVDLIRATELFYNWLGDRTNIVLLTFDLCHVRDFLIRMLGYDEYHAIFVPNARSLQHVIGYYRDKMVYNTSVGFWYMNPTDLHQIFQSLQMEVNSSLLFEPAYRAEQITKAYVRALRVDKVYLV